jgi:hypothetical protein
MRRPYSTAEELGHTEVILPLLFIAATLAESLTHFSKA